MLIQIMAIGNALDHRFSPSHTKFEARHFSTSSENFEVRQFSTKSLDFNSDFLQPQNQIPEPQHLDFGSRSDDFNSQIQFEDRNSHFSNMKLEFSDREFQHLNFNIE